MLHFNEIVVKKTCFIKAVCITVMTRKKSIVTQKGIVINDKLLFAVKVPAVLIIYVQRLSSIRDKLLIKKHDQMGSKLHAQWPKKNKKIVIVTKKDMV